MTKELAAKVVIWAVSILWVLGLLATALTLYQPYTDYVKGQYGDGAWLSLLQIWYLITMILAGALAAWWGFTRIAKWEEPDDNEEEEADGQEERDDQEHEHAGQQG